jgi:hypothetical protein
MEKITIKNHISDLKTSAAKMLVYNSDNSELLAYFKDITFKLEMIEQLLDIEDNLDFGVIEQAFKTILKQDSELTNVEINIQVKPALRETKIIQSKTMAQLMNSISYPKCEEWVFHLN